MRNLKDAGSASSRERTAHHQGVAAFNANAEVLLKPRLQNRHGDGFGSSVRGRIEGIVDKEHVNRVGAWLPFGRVKHHAGRTIGGGQHGLVHDLVPRRTNGDGPSIGLARFTRPRNQHIQWFSLLNGAVGRDGHDFWAVVVDQAKGKVGARLPSILIGAFEATEFGHSDLNIPLAKVLPHGHP